MDLAVLRRLAVLVGREIGVAHTRGGKAGVDRNLGGFNEAARFYPWVVLRDLNHDAECAPKLRALLLPKPSRYMCFRICVRAVESWLLADHRNIAHFLRVPIRTVPPSPDALRDPKTAFLNLARSSRSRAIRDDILPPPSLSARVGAGYSARVIEFATSHWDPAAAAEVSDSLAGCIKALQALRNP